jgi:hypothetical protein
MSKISKEQQLRDIHEDAITRFDAVHSEVCDERKQCLEDRRFYTVAGAQWEGPLAGQYENKAKFEVNKIMLAIIRIVNDYRNNPVSVDFVSKDGRENDRLAEICTGLYRADEQDSAADEAYDNAFEEAVGGGMGAWRIRAEYEDGEDEDDERQRVKIEPIFDADSTVFFDTGAKRQDKSDATRCWVLTPMATQAYIDEYGDDPASWPKDVTKSEFDWVSDDAVWIAEYYVVEHEVEVVFVYKALDDSEERYSQADFDADPELKTMLDAIGSVEVRQKKIKRKRVHKYLMSGGRVLEDCGFIAGRHIPIVPVYGKRSVVDNIERCAGHVRLAKDAQRLKNMQLSKLGEISAESSVEKPILTPQQIAGHTRMWSQDNIKRYPYLLVNPMVDANGNETVGGPVAYTRASQIPPAMAALLQVTETDMTDILGNPQGADKMVSGISGKAVEMIQQRVDGQAYIYMSNFRKAMKRSGEIWLSMARELYVEESRRMKTIGPTGKAGSIELARPTLNAESGEVEYENDLTEANFDVVSEVGPTSSSKKQATVRSLTGMLQITQDPETAQVLTAMAMMNMEGEGLSDTNAFFRKRLLRMGAIKPTEEEAQEMAQEAQSEPQDPNSIYLAAAAEEAQAQAAKARADTVEKIASAELKEAQAIKTLSEVEQPMGQLDQAPPAQQEPMAAQASPTAEQATLTEQQILEKAIELEEREIKLAKQRLELYTLQRKIEMEEEKHALEMRTGGVEVERDEDGKVLTRVTMDERSERVGMQMAEAVDSLKEVIKAQAETIQSAAERGAEAQSKTAEILSRPRTIVREKGKVVGIKIED